MAEPSIEEQIAKKRTLLDQGGAPATPYTPPLNAVSGSGTDFQGAQVKDGRLTPEYQDALSTRFEQLGQGNPLNAAGTASASPVERQIAMMRSLPIGLGGMSFGYTAPVGFSA